MKASGGCGNSLISCKVRYAQSFGASSFFDNGPEENPYRKGLASYPILPILSNSKVSWKLFPTIFKAAANCLRVLKRNGPVP